jgi:peptidoglycan-associated lipoprotein
MLVMMGAKADQIEAISWGEEKPRAGGHDDASWAENRRADFASRYAGWGQTPTGKSGSDPNRKFGV